MLNRVILMGRLVADPDMRTTTSGIPVATLRLAVDRDFKNKQTGEKEADFFNVVAWRQTAEFVSRYFTKGRMAVVEGKLQSRSYVDRDNNKRTAIEVVADNVYFGDSKRDGDGGGYGRPAYSAPGPASGGGYPAAPYGGAKESFAAPAGDSFAAHDQQSSGGYAAPTGADQFNELTGDDGDLPF